MKQSRCIYVSPSDGGSLMLEAMQVKGQEVLTGRLLAGDGQAFAIEDGIPDFTYPKALDREQSDALAYYQDAAKIYDDVANLTFRIQRVDEAMARDEFIDLLDLRPDHRVLEVACGTGRDSENIARRLAPSGELYLQDLSRAMLSRCRDRLVSSAAPVEYAVANACYLPFPDGYFDAIFSFGGLGVFGDIKRSLNELVRVAKPGAKVVVGDESMPPWLYETEYGRILLSNNPLFRLPVPLEHVPFQARDVVLRWVIGGVYYLLEFRVGEGEPEADFDLQIPGRRGGTLRTRYYGRLEGVTPEAFDLAQKAREKSGKSMHDWLDEVVRAAAKNQLGSS